MSTDLLIVFAILLSIGLGYYFKINIGYFAISFGYLIAAFVMGMTPRNIIGMWPTGYFFLLFGITLFYGFALANGTLDALSRRIVYLARNKPFMIPFALALTCFIVAGVGPGSYAVLVFMPPIIMGVAKQIGMKPLLGTYMIVAGANAGGWILTAFNGLLTKSLIEQGGYVAEAGQFAFSVWVNTVVAMVIMIAVSYILLKGYKVTPANFEKPPALNRDQKVNIVLIALLLICLVVPAALSAIFPANKALASFAGKMDLPLLCMIGVVAACFLKIGDERKALSLVPWGTIILLCGVGVLIETAVRAGTIKVLAAFISGTLSVQVMPYGVAVVSGIMSLFSSTIGVVMPTLYPVVKGIVQQVPGVSPTQLFSVIPIAAGLTGFSPFSTVGAVCVAAVAAIYGEAERQKLFSQMLVAPFANLLGVLILILLGLTNF